MASGQIAMAALGRPFALGMLYDACTDELETGFTPWDKITIGKLRKQESQPNSEFGLATSDNMDSRDVLVDVNESLKVGVMCGLIDIKQSAKFMINTKKSMSQNRFLLQYTTTTVMENLSLTPDEAKSLLVQDFFEKTQATHVVTGILKGAHAFFVFDSKNTEKEKLHDIEATVESVVNNPVNVGGGFKCTDEVKAKTENLSCEFHGDFILDKNPKNFEDAMNTYSELSKLLGENGEKAVPVKVWLTPLKNLNPSAAEQKRVISDGLLRRVKNALESLKEVEMKCDEALGDEVMKKIPQIEKKLKRFLNLCKDYRTNLQNNMKEKIPLIRRGLEEETSLKKLLDDQEKSPFTKKNLDIWLKNAEKEIDVINTCVNILKKATVVQKEAELKIKARDAHHKNSLCFVFTSVKPEDPYLDQMDKYLNGETQTTERVPPPPEDQWFHLEDVCKNMEKKARKMSKPPKFPFFYTPYNYFIAALPNDKHEGATVYHYKKGKKKNEDFRLSKKKLK